MIEFERTKKLAKIRKMSLREVNDKAKLGTNSIYKWKTNKPGSDALAAVATALNTTTDYLKGLTDNPSIPTSTDKRRLTWRDLGQSYGGDDPVPDDFQSLVDSLAEGYFKSNPELRKKNNDD